MHRTHTCGELNLNHLNQEVTLSGWVQKSRDLGGTTFIDMRDRYALPNWLSTLMMMIICELNLVNWVESLL